MKAGIDKILQRTQAEYLDSLTPPRDALLARIEQYAAEHNHPIADPEVAQIERILVRALRPRHIIEVGTNMVHGSDSPESGQREAALFFPNL